MPPGDLHRPLRAHRAGVCAGAASDTELRLKYRDEQALRRHSAGWANARAFATGNALCAVDLRVHAMLLVADERNRFLWAGFYAGVAGEAERGIAGGELTFLGGESFGGAMFGARAAFCVVLLHDAAFAVEFGQGDLSALFFCQIQRHDGPIRADASADVAIKIAKTHGEIQSGLQHSAQTVLPGRGLENLRRAGGDTEPARRAGIQKTRHAPAARRSDGGILVISRLPGFAGKGLLLAAARRRQSGSAASQQTEKGPA